MDKKEIEQQLQECRRENDKCVQREEYLKETVELDSEDNVDQHTIFNGVDDSSAPEDMAVLWEQQRTIIGTSSPCGNRWHPK